MNDRPSSGQYPDAGYDGLSTTTFAGAAYYDGSLDAGFGNQQQSQGYGYAYDPYGTYSTQQTYETGTYDATAWNTSSQEAYLAAIPVQTVPEDTTGQWDASAWNGSTAYEPNAFGYDTSGQESGHWAMPGFATGATETGSYDATAWNGSAAEELPRQYTPSYGYEEQPAPAAHDPYGQQPAAYGEYAGTAELPDYTAYAAPEPATGYDEASGYDETPGYDEASGYEEHAAAEGTAVFEAVVEDAPEETGSDVGAAAAHREPEPAAVAPAPRSARRTAPAASAAGRGRRRTPAKRSALLTVAVPSVCVMGVAGVAAASVGGLTDSRQTNEQTTTLAAPDPASVKPVAANNKLDTQLAALSADAGDFADRASRTQERIDLRARQEADRKKRAEEAARKEALRPKFSLPVAQHGLSARFGQSGLNWMSLHTGIDFPVGLGTPVMAATDGTVHTRFNVAYGNMAIVTAPDGTETWYCHLGSTKLRSGPVKAGDVIAYSGDSGNSTGPHLHFEVRPGGGSAIDPLSWLRAHGLNPT